MEVPPHLNLTFRKVCIQDLFVSTLSNSSTIEKEEKQEEDEGMKGEDGSFLFKCHITDLNG